MLSFQVTDAALGVLGQTLSGDLAVDRTAGGDLVLGFANASLSLGGAVAITGGSGLLVLTANGVAGRLSGTVTVQAPGVSFGAGLTLSVNTTGAAVARTLTVGTTDVRLDLPAGPYLRVDGTGVTVTILDQVLTADVAVRRTLAADGTTLTVIGLDRVSLTLSAGTAALRLVNGSGLLVVSGSAVAGRLTGQVALALPGVTAAGTFGVALNTGAARVVESLEVGAGVVTLDVPGGPYLRFEATGLTLTVLGQSISGDFAVEKVRAADGTDRLKVAGRNVTLSVGGLLSVSDGTALLLRDLRRCRGHRLGHRCADRPGGDPRRLAPGRAERLPGRLEETFIVAGVPTTLTLDGGPYVRVTGTGLDARRARPAAHRGPGRHPRCRQPRPSHPPGRGHAPPAGAGFGRGHRDGHPGGGHHGRPGAHRRRCRLLGRRRRGPVGARASPSPVTSRSRWTPRARLRQGRPATDVALAVLGQTLVGDVTVEQLATGAGPGREPRPRRRPRRPRRRRPRVRTAPASCC